MNHAQLAELIAIDLQYEELNVSDVGGSSQESMVNVTDPETGKEFVILVRHLDEDAEDEDW